MDPTGVWQDRMGTPSTSTVQAPHCPSPHPNLVPVSPRSSRSTFKSGSSPSALFDHRIGRIQSPSILSEFVIRRYSFSIAANLTGKVFPPPACRLSQVSPPPV